jgi:hypothetical protein
MSRVLVAIQEELMWIVFSLVCIAGMLVFSSTEIIRHDLYLRDDDKKFRAVVNGIFVQTLISLFVLVAAGYLMTELDKVTEIRRTTNNVTEFLRSVFDGFAYVFGLGFLAYAYKRYKNEVLNR